MNGDEALLDASNRDDAKSSCCGGRCTSVSCCGSCLRVWKCRSAKDSFFLFSVIGLFISLLVALVLPPVLNYYLNQGVDEQVIMIPTNPNLAQWESNIPGAKTGMTVNSVSTSSSSAQVGDPALKASTDDISGGGVPNPNDNDGTIHYDIRFFNVTNPREMMAGAKPALQQVGPYGYTEYFQKFDVSWSADQEEVTYNQQKYYVWSAQNTGAGLTQDDEITLIYPVVIGFQYLMGQLGANVTALAEAAIAAEMEVYYNQLMAALDKAIATIDGEKLLPPKRKAELESQVKEIQDEIEVFYAQIAAFIAESDPTDLLLKVVLGKSPNGLTPFFKQKPGPAYFGWLKDPVLMEVQKVLDAVAAKTNVTVPWTTAVPGSVANLTSMADAKRRVGPTTVKTGKGNIDDVGKLLIFQGMTSIYGCPSPMKSQNTSQYIEGEEFPACELFNLAWNVSEAESKGYHPAWADPSTNLIYGRYGDGELYPRPVNPDSVPIFVGDIYRGAVLTSTSTVDWYGVDLYRLQIQSCDMLNSTEYPPNANYFSLGPMGLINLTSAMGAPAFGSYPHFLGADPRMLNAVTGLQPDPETMSTFLDVEPFTGLLAQARKQMQTNYLLSNQSFPATPEDEDWKAEAHYLCGNISAVLVELHQEALPCGDLPEVDFLLDLLAEKGGWSLFEGGIDGGTFFPYAYSDEYMNLPESDANSIKSTVYAVQDAQKASHQWGLISTGVFACLTLYLITSRVLNGESLGTILCFRSDQPAKEIMYAEQATPLKQPLLYDAGLAPSRGSHAAQSGHSDTHI
jgi:hypothetical protein